MKIASRIIRSCAILILKLKPIVMVNIVKLRSGLSAGNSKPPENESHSSEVFMVLSAISEPSIIPPIINSAKYKIFFILFSTLPQGYYFIPEEPNPFVPRPVSERQSLTSISGINILVGISCAILIPFSTVNGNFPLFISGINHAPR